MKKLLLLLFLFPGIAYARFSDVDLYHPSYTAIGHLQQTGVVKGYSDGTFGPDKLINRVEFLKIIVESLNINNDCIKEFNYSDVNISDWFNEYIQKASCKNIVSGYPDGTFKPGKPINFVEAAKIIVTAFSKSNSLETEWPDEQWYKVFVDYLANKRAIPISIDSFEKPITRGEMAEIIYRLELEHTAKPYQTFASILYASNPTAGKWRLLDGRLSEHTEKIKAEDTLRYKQRNKFPTVRHLPTIESSSTDELKKKEKENGLFADIYSFQGAIENQSELVLYRNADLGIQFLYPAVWGDFVIYYYPCVGPDKMGYNHPTEKAVTGYFKNLQFNNHQIQIGTKTKNCMVDRGTTTSETISLHAPDLKPNWEFKLSHGNIGQLWYGYPYGWATEGTLFVARFPIKHPEISYIGIIGPFSNSALTTEKEILDFLTVIYSYKLIE